MKMNETQRLYLKRIVNEFNEENDILFQVEHNSSLFSNIFCNAGMSVSCESFLVDLANELRDVLINSGIFRNVTNILFSATKDSEIRLTICVF